MSATLQNSFEKQEQSSAYSEQKPVVDVDLRYCPKKDRPRMISIINRLAKSPSGLETLQVAAENGYHFNFTSEKRGTRGFTDHSKKRIALNPVFPDEKLIGTLCHECRHAGQFSRASDLCEEKWDVKTNLMYMRAMEADAQAYAATACEELSRLGDKGPKLRFYKDYPEISMEFTKALLRNNKELCPAVLTETFKAWYDQSEIKSAYEESYLLEPMQKELRNIAKGNDAAMTFETSVPARKVIEEIAWTKNGCYFKDDPEILNGGKYLDVCEFTEVQMQKFFAFRKEMTGKDDSKALDGVPTRGDSYDLYMAPIVKPVVKQPKRKNLNDKETAGRQKVSSGVLAKKMARGR